MTRPVRFRQEESIGEGGVRLELWAQPGMVERGELDGVLEPLRELERRGDADAAVETWDRFVDLSADVDGATRRVRRRIAGFAAATSPREERANAKITRDSGRAGDAVRVRTGRLGPERLAWHTPPAALVEVRDGVVVRVTPGSDSTGSIRRRLDELARAPPAIDQSDDRERPATDRSEDPDARLHTGCGTRPTRTRGGRRSVRSRRAAP